MKTKILWWYWIVDDGETPGLDDIAIVVKQVKRNPNAKLVHASDSEGDTFLVLAIGDTTPHALRDALDRAAR